MTGAATERRGQARTRPEVVLLGLGTMLAGLWQDCPLASLLTSGLLTAGALGVIGKRAGLATVAACAGAVALASVVGGPIVSTVTLAAVLAAVVYAGLRQRFPRDDDQFFLAPLCFWVVLAGLVGVALAVGGDAVRTMLGQLRADVLKDLDDVIEAARKVQATQKPKPEAVAVFGRSQVAISLVVLGVMFQAFLGFVATRFARRRLGWIDPLAGRFVRFRVHERYSLLLILGLAFLVAGPYIHSAAVEAFVAAVLTLFATGCFLAGIACALFVVERLLQSGRWLAARIYLLGMLLVLLLQQLPAFAIIGLVDVWFDIRRLTPKKGEA